ncbi:DUF4244 domain-containing protein [Streptomyces cyaneofuscatus]|uniref:DUF4244 domain-containing protein n=1 Tax=Streptomyces cyaneofuscatus TaxID=66883 RepID=UPI0036BE3ADD
MNKKFEGRTELTERREEEGRTGGEGRAVGALCRTARATRSAGRSAATRVARWQGRLGESSDRGMTTSEYAVGTIAACAFAAVLYKVVNSGPVMSAMQSMIEGSLDAKF